MRNIAIIPARSGSKGLPDKNIKLLNSKPLLAYSIEAALKSGCFDEVMVSTDSEHYAEIAKNYGASVPFLRSEATSSDTASSWDMVEEVLANYQKLGKSFDTFCLLQPTSPLRTAEDIKAAYALYEEKASFAVVSVCETEHSPLWAGQLPENHEFVNFIDSNSPKRRQDAGKFYRINGAIYIVNVERFKTDKFLYQEGSFAYVMPQDRSVDIDSRLDFKLAEVILKMGNMRWLLSVFPDYEIITAFDNIEDKTKKSEVHGLTERTGTKCLFCGRPYEKWTKKDEAHAISECLGNKSLINFLECYECNHTFGEIAENNLGKFIMPYRFINEVFGKGKPRNVIRDEPKDKVSPFENYRFEQRKSGTPVFESETFDVSSIIIEKPGGYKLKMKEDGFVLGIPRQNYDPLWIYPAFFKMFFSLLPLQYLPYYLKGLLSLYLVLSGKPYVNDNGDVIQPALSDEKREQCLSDWSKIDAFEVRYANKNIPNGVNVCLLKRADGVEPQMLFAIQMKWYTLVFPFFSDECKNNNSTEYKIQYKLMEDITVRKLDFSEKELICEMTGEAIEIPKDLYSELSRSLSNAGLLRKEAD